VMVRPLMGDQVRPVLAAAAVDRFRGMARQLLA
jgi:hypothetical protein